MPTGNNMRVERVTRFWSIRTVASSIGVHPNTLARWERGEAEPSANGLLKLAHLYGVTPDYLMGYAADKHSTAMVPA